MFRYTYSASLVECTINCAQHTDSSYRVNVQYTKTEMHCILRKPEGDLDSWNCVE
jgi:hypothetical protein